MATDTNLQRRSDVSERDGASSIDNQRGAWNAKKRWNDIRRVGPVLMMAFVAVLMINPTFAGGGVGSLSTTGCPGDDVPLTGVVSIGEPDPDCGSPCISGASPSVGFTSTWVPLEDLCIPDVPEPVETTTPTTETADDAADGESDDAAAETVAAPTPQPTPRVVPRPPAIVGPIWLGAIQPTVIAPGVVELQFPAMLDIFIADNGVKITGANGVELFNGALPESGALTVFGEAPMTVTTGLTNGARYTEVIPG